GDHGGLTGRGAAPVRRPLPATMSGAVAVIVAAGRGTRLGGDVPKPFRSLGGSTLVAHAVRALVACPGIEGAIVVVAPEEIGGPRATAVGALGGVLAVVPGGASRLRSALAGVEAAEGAEIVLVHDAARPFVAPATVAAVLAGVERHGAAVPALAVRDTVKRDDGAGLVAATVDREPLRLAPTPEGARRALLLGALRRAVAEGADVTDEAQAIERTGAPVAIVPGDPGNVKITTAADHLEAERRLARAGDAELRVGHGYDVHAFGGG